jgi:acyl dehydratase
MFEFNTFTLQQTTYKDHCSEINILALVTPRSEKIADREGNQMQAIERYLEDFEVGQTFSSDKFQLEKERMKAFAAEFDPQPFHLDEEAARDTIFGGLAASGWYTAAITMKLLVESDLKPAGGIVGAGFEEFRWALPVRPGDQLHVESEVLNVRPSKSRPDKGLLKVRMRTLNQNDEAVQVAVVNFLVPRRSGKNYTENLN